MVLSEIKLVYCHSYFMLRPTVEKIQNVKYCGAFLIVRNAHTKKSDKFLVYCLKSLNGNVALFLTENMFEE